LKLCSKIHQDSGIDSPKNGWASEGLHNYGGKLSCIEGHTDPFKRQQESKLLTDNNETPRLAGDRESEWQSSQMEFIFNNVMLLEIFLRIECFLKV